MNFTSTVSEWRIDMAVCNHLNRTWNLRPKGSGPASNWRKFCLYGYLTMGLTLSMLKSELGAPHQSCQDHRKTAAPAAEEVRVRVDARGICGSGLPSHREGPVGDTPSV